MPERPIDLQSFFSLDLEQVLQVSLVGDGGVTLADMSGHVETRIVCPGQRAGGQLDEALTEPWEVFLAGARVTEIGDPYTNEFHQFTSVYIGLYHQY